MRKQSIFFAGAAVLALASPAAAVPADFKAKADSIVAQAWPADGPGAAVIVTEGGKIVYQRGEGLADIDAKTPITPATVFRLGSITKQFSATVVLQLAAEGKLSLDDPLSKFLPDYPQPGGSATVRQLLNHTSGIQSYTDMPGWMVEANTNRPYTTDQAIAVFKDRPSPNKPGEVWAYNNSGYTLVGAIIEKVTGKPWHEAIRERLTGPLHLSTIRYGGLESGTALMATGYGRDESGKPVPAEKIDMSLPHAAGGLIGTVGDLAGWANALHHGRVIPAASYAAMTSPSKTADGKVNPYGFGIAIDEIRGHKTLGHGGGIFGFITESTYLPEQDVFVAVFSNAAPPVTPPALVAGKLAMLAIGDAFPDFHKQPLDMQAIEPMLGLYKVEGGDLERVFFERDGKLYTRRSDAREQQVWPAGNGRFFYENGMTWFDIKPSDSALTLAMYQGGTHTPELSRRTGPVPVEKAVEVPREILERYVGSYKVGPALAVVTMTGEGLAVKLGPQPTFRLIPRSATEFTVETAGALVRFPEGEGPAKSMTISQAGRTMEAPRAE